jgi:exodeoxyribonuclease V gamma subunit
MTLSLHPLLTLPDLADAMARCLRHPPPGDDPFATDVLVVGGRGVEQWLRLALAERLDIVTNIELRSPSRFLQDLERWATGATPASASTLTLDVLATVQRDRTLLPPELRHLGTEHETGTPAVGTVLTQWATRMARTFERYLLHRHERILAWERGTVPSDPTEAWQARLWRALLAHRARELGPAAAFDATCRALTSSRALDVSPRWLLVHHGRLAPAHLQLARALATHREVHLFVHAATTPGVALFTEHDLAWDRTLHATTLRLDRARVDALRLVHSTLSDVASLASGAPAVMPADTHLLAAVQHTLRTPTRDGSERRTVTAARPDDSFRVFACHGALRQVEVLRDALLGALDTDPTLEPRDILVLTPDPARFVPLLQALLPLGGGARDEPYHDERPSSAAGVPRREPPALPLHVQGRAPRALNPVADVLLQLLALAESRVTASRVLALIERGPVAEQFGLTSTETPLVREWFRTAGVRWGIDAEDPERTAMGLDDHGTWQRALHRVLLGTAVLDDGEWADTHTAGYAPVPGLEGERVLLAGRAVRAVRRVLDGVVNARTPRSLAAWATFVDDTLGALVRADGAYASSASRVREVMQSLGRTSSLEHTAGGLATLLEHRLEEVLTTPGRLGGITVAPLSAGWVRPTRVIGLLGMDDELFPGRTTTPWFDTLSSSPQPGDPDERGDQLQTVFDAITMAQDRLLVTYTGWNRAGTMRLPPSVAIAALQEVVHDIVGDAASAPVADAWAQHVARDVPLQSFSRRAFVDDTTGTHGVPSYDAIAARTANALARRHPSAPQRRAARASDAQVLTHRHMLPLATLVRFLTRPAEEILARLGVHLGTDDALLDDVLPLTMPRYDEAAAVTGLADALLLGETVDTHFEALQHRDRLPPTVLGEAWRHYATERARHLAARARTAVHDLPRRAPMMLRVDLGRTVLTGTIDRRHGPALLTVRDSKMDLSRLIAPFVRLCAAAACDASITHAVHIDADDVTHLGCPADPLAVLRDLVDLYHDADRAVPAYTPGTAFAYETTYRTAVQRARAHDDGATVTPHAHRDVGTRDEAAHALALDAARQAWMPDDPTKRGECEQPANRLLHAVSPVDDAAFATLARAVAAPVLSAMEDT